MKIILSKGGFDISLIFVFVMALHTILSIAKSFDILARQENIKELPDVDVEQLPVGEIYYKKNEKTLVKIVSKNGKKVPIATPY